jgi:hypothetical protein
MVQYQLAECGRISDEYINQMAQKYVSAASASLIQSAGWLFERFHFRTVTCCNLEPIPQVP